MSLTYVTGDLLDSKLPFLGHGCNCFHTMGSGIAPVIRGRYPMVYVADVSHHDRGNIFALGSASSHQLPSGQTFLNLYTQYRTGPSFEYAALSAALDYAHGALGVEQLGLPRIGCGIGGGEWHAVAAIIRSSPIDITVYTLPDHPEAS
jgi:O-acetyl-ADP-ribose deacetylase (regulator of RNase III)